MPKTNPIPQPCNGCDCVDYAGDLNDDGYCAECMAEERSA
jgi:hypothetical protein